MQKFTIKLPKEKSDINIEILNGPFVRSSRTIAGDLLHHIEMNNTHPLTSSVESNKAIRLVSESDCDLKFETCFIVKNLNSMVRSVYMSNFDIVNNLYTLENLKKDNEEIVYECDQFEDFQEQYVHSILFVDKEYGMDKLQNDLPESILSTDLVEILKIKEQRMRGIM